jgi:hypothetical protein
VVFVRTEKEGLAALRADRCGRGALARTYVEGAPFPVAGLAAASNEGLVPLNRATALVSLTPNVLSLDVETNATSVLVTSFPFTTSNWSGTVDGVRVPLLKVNGGFVGLRVPTGHHRLTVRYFARKELLGIRAFFTALAMSLLTILWVNRGRLGRSASLVLTLTAVSGALVSDLLAERRLAEDARRQILLSNSYPQALSAQLARWSIPP